MVDAAPQASVPRWRVWLLRLWEIPFLAGLFWWAFQLRLTGADNLIGGSRNYLSTDPDAFYHLRATLVSVAHFPQVIRWDPFTNYPLGTDTNQFGSLFDVLGAALALIVGHGHPSLHEIYVGAAYLSPLLSAGTLIPFYFLGRKLVGRAGAAAATIALALNPGDFLYRGVVGNYDHHSAEAFGMACAFLGTMVALDAASRAGSALMWKGTADVAAWLRGTRRALFMGLLGALGIVVYFLFWPPAILVIGIFGLVAAIQICLDHLRGRDTRYLAWGFGLAYGFAGLLLLPTVSTTQLNFNTFSLIQPVACFLLALFVVVAHFVSDLLARRKAPRFVLPVLVVGTGLGTFFGLQFFAPGLYGSLRWGASWLTGIAAPRTNLTIAEAQPSDWTTLYTEQGLLVYVGIAMLLLLVIQILRLGRRQDVTLAVWGALMLTGALTQVRFNEYLALADAMLFGYLVYELADWTGLNAGLARFFLPEEEKPTKQKGRRTRAAARASVASWQFAAVGASALLLVPVLIAPTDGGVPAWQAVKGAAYVSPNVEEWNAAAGWLKDHSPSPGFDLTTIYSRPAPGEPNTYPQGTYGVLSWWDYGHQIELAGERPPVANPFQQHAPFASLFFTSENETLANGMLDKLTSPTHAGPVRYVMIDDEMAASKFGAIAVWANWNRWARAEDKRAYRMPDGSVSPELYYQGQPFFHTMMTRLYFDDASGLSHYRLVHELDTFSAIGNVYDKQQGNVRCFNDLLPSSSCPLTVPTNFQQLSSGNQIVDLGDNRHYAYDVRIDANVKTFEYVPGAHLRGFAPAGSTVSVRVDLRADHGSGSGAFSRPVSWSGSVTTAPGGTYEIVVPYATTTAVPLSQGGTDVAIKATGPATVTVAGTEKSLDIPDAAVLGGDTVVAPSFP